MAVDLKTFDIPFEGGPCCDVSAKDSLDLKTMDWSVEGQPFVSNSGTYIPPVVTYVVSIAGVAIASVAKFVSVAKASIAKINGTPLS